MPDRLITKQSVFQAADALKTQKQKVTYRAIRKLMNGGSPNDILPHLNDWRVQELAHSSAAADASNVGAEVEQCLRDATKRISAICSRQLDAERERAAHQNDAVAQAIAMQQEALEHDLLDFQSEVDALQMDLNRLRSELDEQRQRNNSLAEQLAAERRKREVAEAIQATTEQLTAELKAAHAALANELAGARDAVRAAAEREARDRHSIAEERSRTEQALVKLSVTQTSADAAAERAREADAQQAAQFQRVSAELNDARAQAADAGERANRLQGELDATRAECNDLLAVLQTANHAATRGKAQANSRPLAG